MNIKDKLLKLSDNSYCKYSNFPVASILITKDGKEYKGVNVENASYGETICAERNAITTAITNGENPNNFKEIHIIANHGKSPAYPCGSCRQVISEFFNEDTDVIIHFKDKEEKLKVKELLPRVFKSKYLNDK